MATIAELAKEVKDLRRQIEDLRAHVSDDGVHALTGWEREEVRKGLADRLATDAEVQAVFEKYGLSSAI